MILFSFLLHRFGGRPMLSGLLLMACGIVLVVIWVLTGGGRGTVMLIRYGILCTLAGAALAVVTAYRGRRESRATPPGDREEETR